MIILGYAVIFVYIAVLIFGVGTLLQKLTNTETSRKCIHTMLFLVWVFIDLFLRDTIHQIIIPVLFIILNALSYKLNIYKSVEREDGNHLGTVYFAIAVTAVMTISYFVKDMYPYSGIAVFCLTFGDGFAALIGYNIKSRKICDSKSLGGFIACFAASFLSLIVFKFVYLDTLSYLVIAIISALAAILELCGDGLDNFSVTFGTFFVSYALSTPSSDLTHALIFAILVFLIVFLSGAIRYYGALLALCIVFVFRYCGGELGLIFLLACYFTAFIAGFVKKKFSRGPKKDSQRGFAQILINGGLGTAAMISFALTNDIAWIIVSCIAIGGCFVDSISSDVGILSRSDPYDPIRRKKVSPGLSGGMSILGTSAALLASAAIGTALTLSLQISVAAGVVISLLIFAQTILDTVLGSLVQVKYRCSSCGDITEKRVHCDSPTVYFSGIHSIDNNGVNIISSAVITAVAIIAFVLV